jgi:hypothetical protein
MSVAGTLIALRHAVELAALATEFAAAAQRISTLVLERQEAGRPLTDEDWAGLLNDRRLAQALLAASIARRQEGQS